MRVIGLLCFYAESPTWLAACVSSMSRFCDHVVACDGGYRLFPGATSSSGAPSHDAIVKSAEAVGLGLTLYIPPRIFDDNEVEKRSLAFRLGEAIATPEEDFYFILDADEVVIEHPVTLHEDLERTSLDVGTARMVDRIDWHKDEQVEQLARAGFFPSKSNAESRRFYRAIPGLKCVGNHYTFLAERDGEQRTLRGLERFGVDQSLDFGVVIEHRRPMRTVERAASRDEYYRLRDSLKAELEPEDMVRLS
jgi:hypothetical protein